MPSTCLTPSALRHYDPPRPLAKKPNATRELKIELRIPDDTLRLWRAPPVEGARRRVLRVIVPAMSARVSKLVDTQRARGVRTATVGGGRSVRLPA